MRVSVYSREAIESVIADGTFPENTAVISFYDPAIKRIDEDYSHVDYSSVCNTVFYSELDDLDALGFYARHPLHLEVQQFVREVVCDRAACDFEAE